MDYYTTDYKYHYGVQQSISMADTSAILDVKSIAKGMLITFSSPIHVAQYLRI